MTLLGAGFLFLGALGVFRMPDVYNRMQAGTKATTLGTALFLSGMAFKLGGDAVGKLVLLILFVIFTNPVSSHALARAAHKAGIPLTSRSVQDDLARERGEEQV